MNEVVLSGCAPTSLASYLKGLGILRLVAEQLDNTVRAYWKGGHLVLTSQETTDELRRFFLRAYKPTPIISPWSGRAGFLEGDAGEDSTRKGATTLRTLTNSSGARFQGYRDVVAAIGKVSVIAALDRARSEVKRLESLDKAKKLEPDGRDAFVRARKELDRLKDGLLGALRAELDDAFLPWIDACFVLAGSEATAAPLLGSGGNEGSMDFSINHVEALLSLIDSNTDAPTARSAPMLDHALFAETQYMDLTSNIGFLSVASAGGVNMSTGFAGTSNENPWNSVLVLEGIVLFAASATKKLASGERAGLSFPFMVAATLAGDGSVSANERTRPELWLPLWTFPASIAEIKFLFSEGRSTLGFRQARSGLDMLEALSELGTSRGAFAFERFGFFERRGRGYFVAGHLGSYKAPREKKDSFVVGDLKQHRWLNDFIKFASGKNVAGRFRTLRRHLEDRLFDMSDHEPLPSEMQSFLILLGDIQQALAVSRKAREGDGVQPIPRLSERWAMAADDGTPEFRIAKALAGLHGVGDIALPLRAQLFPVQRKFNEWTTPEADEKVRIYIGGTGRLTSVLGACLEHRLRHTQTLKITDKPLSSPAGAMLDDVAAFLQDDRMDARIAALLPGLSLCEIPLDVDRTAGDGTLPAAFGLMKLTLTPDHVLHYLGYLGEKEHMPIPAGMLAQLTAGNHENRAVKIAWRRLRASGLAPFFAGTVPSLVGMEPTRAAAALLIPLRQSATAALARTLLEALETEAGEATIR